MADTGGRAGGRALVSPAPPSSDISEEAYQRLITDLADWFGWKWHHETDSRRSNHGFPDLWLAKAYSPLVVWEVKTESGRLHPAQYDWGRVLMSVPGIEYAVVRPHDWSYVVRVLTEARD